MDQDAPAVLRELHGRGMRFAKPTTDFWSVKNQGVALRKDFSVYFLSEVACLSKDILAALELAGGKTDAVTSIQRRVSSQAWVISFATLADKEWALNVGSMVVGETRVTLVDVANDYALVKIYDAPAELPDTVVIGRLSVYGQVVSFRRDCTASGLENGIRTARVRLERVIPPSISIVGERIRIWYPKQPKLCRKCGASDHLARSCNTPRCTNCEKPGHQALLCPDPPLCTLCMSSAHAVVECSFLRYSCNVEREVAFCSYANPADPPVRSLEEENRETTKKELRQEIDLEKRNCKRREAELELELASYEDRNVQLEQEECRDHHDREHSRKREKSEQPKKLDHEREHSREREKSCEQPKKIVPEDHRIYFTAADGRRLWYSKSRVPMSAIKDPTSIYYFLPPDPPKKYF